MMRFLCLLLLLWLPAAALAQEDRKVVSPAGTFEIREGDEPRQAVYFNGTVLKTEGGEAIGDWLVDFEAVVPSSRRPQFIVVSTGTGGNACDIWGLFVVKVTPPVWSSGDLGGCGVSRIQARMRGSALVVETLTWAERNEFGDPGTLTWVYRNGRLRVMPKPAVPDFWAHEGLHPHDFLGRTDIRPPIARVLRGSYRDLRDRLAVSSDTMKAANYRYLVGEGCMAHACGSDDAILLVDAYGGHAWAFYMEGGRKIAAFGPSDRDATIPALPQLEAWLARWGLELASHAAPVEVRPRKG